MIPDDASVSRLMTLSQDGDRDAYRIVLTTSETWLRRYFARRIPPSHLEDLVQETLMTIHVKRGTYDASGSFFAWVAAIARYRWLDHLRGIYRHRRVIERSQRDETDAFSTEPGLERLGLDRMLTWLPPKQAEAIRLTKIEELTAAQASERSGQSEALIRINVHRGLKRLQELVERE